MKHEARQLIQFQVKKEFVQNHAKLFDILSSTLYTYDPYILMHIHIFTVAFLLLFLFFSVTLTFPLSWILKGSYVKLLSLTTTRCVKCPAGDNIGVPMPLGEAGTTLDLNYSTAGQRHLDSDRSYCLRERIQNLEAGWYFQQYQPCLCQQQPALVCHPSDCSGANLRTHLQNKRMLLPNECFCFVMVQMWDVLVDEVCASIY